MTLRARVDLVIFGGGIAGLWLLGRLHSAGYSCLLLEVDGLGGVQTLASQGIIHGGTKYALTGALTGSSQAIAAMPAIWRACLAGRGELDLSRVKVLSEHQYLWSTATLGSRVTGFFASQTMRSRISPVTGNERPEVFRHAAFRGSVYRLDEPVLDTASLTSELARQYGGWARRIPDLASLELEAGQHPRVRLSSLAGRLEIECRRLVLAAGAGNRQLLERLGWHQPAMQLRPLHMLMLRGALPGLYAHCLGTGPNPRLTVTSYPGLAGDRVWYLGGQLAEQGVDRCPSAQIAAGQRELAELLPWLELGDSRWASLRVERAESRHPQGGRPDNWFLAEREGVMVVWPTKLALAPSLAGQAMARLRDARIDPHPGLTDALQDLPLADLAQAPWEEVGIWS